MVISNADDFRQAQRIAYDPVAEGDATGAVAYVDALVAAAGNERNVTALRAAIRTDSTSLHGDAGLLEEAIGLWQTLDPDARADIAFNLANARLGVWELAVHSNRGWWLAWNSVRDHLHEARAAFERIGGTADAPLDLRLKSWTNAGNTYDIVGRDLEAITCYDQALALDGNFGMALGNRGRASCTSED